MRILVTGCRHWEDKLEVTNTIAIYWRLNGKTEIVVGDCPTGVDRMARDHFCELKDEFGEDAGKLEVFSADWDSQGKKAGPMRNQDMVDSGADICLAFWDGFSRGTLDCLTRATVAGIPVRIIPWPKP